MHPTPGLRCFSPVVGASTLFRHARLLHSPSERIAADARLTRYGLFGLVFATEKAAADWTAVGELEIVATPYSRRLLIEAFKRHGCEQVAWNLDWGNEWRPQLRPLTDLEERR